MTTEEYKALPIEKRLFADILLDIRRDMRRIADSLERLVALEDQ